MTKNDRVDLRDHFGKAYVINLDIRPDRWEQFQKRAADVGISGFERYRAIEGDKCPHPAWWRAGNGAWGCLMTHLRIVQDAMMDGLESYVVFEDDAIFKPDFATRLKRALALLEEKEIPWEQLYLGGQHLWKESYPPIPFAKDLVRCVNVNRTHAFAVHQRFMEKFSQHILHAPDYLESHVPEKRDAAGNVIRKEFFRHIDHQLGALHQRRQNLILAMNPWVCGQAADSSNINGRHNPEQWWEETGWGQ